MRIESRTCTLITLVAMLGVNASAQGTGGLAPADPGACAAVLAEPPSIGRDAGTAPDSARTGGDSTGTRAGQLSVGDNRSGADILLLASATVDEIRFASQPRVRIRLCWGGDTLRLVERTNLPSPVVAGTSYRNVYVAVELLGHLNAACLTDRILPGRPTTGGAARAPAAAAAGGLDCAGLTARAQSGQQPRRNP